MTPSDDGRYDATSGRHETEVEKLDRNFDDLLQELRVSQTGVQILFAFLLTLAFTQRFEDIDEFQRNTYVVTLIASAAATILFITPVSYHRVVFRQRMRRELVRDGNRAAMAGLGFLAIAMSGSILLIVDVVLGNTWAAVLTAAVLAFMIVLWYVLPFVQRHRHHP